MAHFRPNRWVFATKSNLNLAVYYIYYYYSMYVIFANIFLITFQLEWVMEKVPNKCSNENSINLSQHNNQIWSLDQVEHPSKKENVSHVSITGKWLLFMIRYSESNIFTITWISIDGLIFSIFSIYSIVEKKIQNNSWVFGLDLHI